MATCQSNHLKFKLWQCVWDYCTAEAAEQPSRTGSNSRLVLWGAHGFFGEEDVRLPFWGGTLEGSFLMGACHELVRVPQACLLWVYPHSHRHPPLTAITKFLKASSPVAKSKQSGVVPPKKPLFSAPNYRLPEATLFPRPLSNAKHSNLCSRKLKVRGKWPEIDLSRWVFQGILLFIE